MVKARRIDNTSNGEPMFHLERVEVKAEPMEPLKYTESYLTFWWRVVQREKMQLQAHLDGKRYTDERQLHCHRLQPCSRHKVARLAKGAPAIALSAVSDAHGLCGA